MSGNPIKRHPIVILGIILFFAVTALIVFRLSSGAKTDARKTRILTVGTMSPIKQDLDVRLTYTADLIPNQLVNIFSRVDGYIAKIYVDKGDLVKANQLLVEIDHTDYVHAVNQAKANLLSAKAKVVQQDAAVRNAALTLDRMQALIKDQFVSQQDLDTAEVNRDAALAMQDSLRAQVQQMAVALGPGRNESGLRLHPRAVCRLYCGTQSRSRRLCERHDRQYLHHVARHPQRP